MLRRTPLRTSKTLRRRTRMRTRKGATKYSRRARDFEFMGWVKGRSCMVLELPPAMQMPTPLGQMAAFKRLTPCGGPIEADHAGARGIGQKADDRTCIPLCQKHHRERHDHAHTFGYLTRDELRAWRTEAITRTQAAWENR